MPFIPYDLGAGRIAHAKQETTLGDMEDYSWLIHHWVSKKPEHIHALLGSVSLAIVTVQKWEGMPEGFVWPELIQPLISDQPAIEQRYQSLREYASVALITKLSQHLNGEATVSEELEGN
jgi:hypothetical protein